MDILFTSVGVLHLLSSVSNYECPFFYFIHFFRKPSFYLRVTFGLSEIGESDNSFAVLGGRSQKVFTEIWVSFWSASEEGTEGSPLSRCLLKRLQVYITHFLFLGSRLSSSCYHECTPTDTNPISPLRVHYRTKLLASLLSLPYPKQPLLNCGAANLR